MRGADAHRCTTVEWLRRVVPPCRRRPDHGSAAVELVLLTPLLVAILGCVFFAGRLLLARQDVDDAARTAVQAAVTTPDGPDASWLAGITAFSDLRQHAGLCTHGSTTTDTADFVPGGNVFVTVTCVTPFSSLAFLGVPGSITLTSTDGAVLEPYRVVWP